MNELKNACQQRNRNYKKEQLEFLELESTITEMKKFTRGFQQQIYDDRKENHENYPGQRTEKKLEKKPINL
jgi:hypothetical protein